MGNSSAVPGGAPAAQRPRGEWCRIGPVVAALLVAGTFVLSFKEASAAPARIIEGPLAGRPGLLYAGPIEPGSIVVIDDMGKIAPLKVVPLTTCFSGEAHLLVRSLSRVVDQVELALDSNSVLAFLEGRATGRESDPRLYARAVLQDAIHVSVDLFRVTEWLTLIARDANSQCRELLADPRAFVAIEALRAREARVSFETTGTQIEVSPEVRQRLMVGTQGLGSEKSPGLTVTRDSYLIISDVTLLTRVAPLATLIREGTERRFVEQRGVAALRRAWRPRFEGVLPEADERLLRSALSERGVSAQVSLGASVLQIEKLAIPVRDDLVGQAKQLLEQVVFTDAIVSPETADVSIEVVDTHDDGGSLSIDFQYFVDRVPVEGALLTAEIDRSAGMLTRVAGAPLTLRQLAAIEKARLVVLRERAVSREDALLSARRALDKARMSSRGLEVGAPTRLYTRPGEILAEYRLVWRVPLLQRPTGERAPRVPVDTGGVIDVDGADGSVLSLPLEKLPSHGGDTALYQRPPGPLMSFAPERNGDGRYRSEVRGDQQNGLNGIQVFLEDTGQYAVSADNHWREPENAGVAELIYYVRDLQEFFREQFNYRGVEGVSESGKPRSLVVIIKPKDREPNVAEWDTTAQMFFFGHGDQVRVRHPARDFTVVAHEYVHAVRQFLGRAPFLYCRGDGGALEESIADVLAVLVRIARNEGGIPDRDAWRVGEDGLSGYYRDLAEPTIRTHQGVTVTYDANDSLETFEMKGYPQPDTDSVRLTRLCGGPDGKREWSAKTIAHINSGIANRAASLLYHGDERLGVQGTPNWRTWAKVYFSIIRKWRVIAGEPTFLRFSEVMQSAVAEVVQENEENLRITCDVYNAWAAVGVGKRCQSTR